MLLRRAITTSFKLVTNFSDLSRPHDRYERVPTRGRPSAGPRGNRWQTRRLNSLNSDVHHERRVDRRGAALSLSMHHQAGST